MYHWFNISLILYLDKLMAWQGIILERGRRAELASIQGYLSLYSSCTISFTCPFISPQSATALKHALFCLLCSHKYPSEGVLMYRWNRANTTRGAELLCAAKTVAGNSELPLTKSSLGLLNSQLTTSQASSWSNYSWAHKANKEIIGSTSSALVHCMFCLAVRGKKDKHSPF